MTPHRVSRKILFSFVPSSNALYSESSRKPSTRAFCADTAFQGPSTSLYALLPELKRFKGTVRCAAIDEEINTVNTIEANNQQNTHFSPMMLECEQTES